MNIVQAEKDTNNFFYLLAPQGILKIETVIGPDNEIYKLCKNLIYSYIGLWNL